MRSWPTTVGGSGWTSTASTSWRGWPRVGAHDHADEAGGPGSHSHRPDLVDDPLARVGALACQPWEPFFGCFGRRLRPAIPSARRARRPPAPSSLPMATHPRDEHHDLADELGQLDQIVGGHEHELAIPGRGSRRSLRPGLVGYGGRRGSGTGTGPVGGPPLARHSGGPFPVA
jgi:hypothetical protein